MIRSNLINPFWEVEDCYTAIINGRPLCHESWAAMRPVDEDRISAEAVEEYCTQILQNPRLDHIPKEVLSQWIYPFNDDYNSLHNYAWINYYDARFRLVDMPLELLLYEVRPNQKGQELVDIRAALSDFSKFPDEDNAEYWKTQGTWKVPPVILDVDSFEDSIPEWADIKPPYVLIEGHNRLGYLRAVKSMADMGGVDVRPFHQVYLLSGS